MRISNEVRLGCFCDDVVDYGVDITELFTGTMMWGSNIKFPYSHAHISVASHNNLVVLDHFNRLISQNAVPSIIPCLEL